MVRNMNIKDEDTGPIKKVSMVNKMSNNSSAKLQTKVSFKNAERVQDYLYANNMTTNDI